MVEGENDGNLAILGILVDRCDYRLTLDPGEQLNLVTRHDGETRSFLLS